jgi:hypothetical protein
MAKKQGFKKQDQKSQAEKRILEEERDRVVAHYRLLKEKQRLQFTNKI